MFARPNSVEESPATWPNAPSALRADSEEIAIEMHTKHIEPSNYPSHDRAVSRGTQLRRRRISVNMNDGDRVMNSAGNRQEYLQTAAGWKRADDLRNARACAGRSEKAVSKDMWDRNAD